MQTNFTNWQGRRGDQARTRVVIAYDTATMGRQAMRALGRAMDKVESGGSCVDIRLWRLDLLADSELRRMAEADLGEADMLLLAIEGPHSLPSAMDSWLQVMGKNKEAGAGGLALMINIDGRETDDLSCHAVEVLRSGAEANRMDFLTNILPSLSRVELGTQRHRSACGPSTWQDVERFEFSRGWGDQ